MSHSQHNKKRTLERLLKYGLISNQQYQQACRQLQIYPSPHTWLAFFDKALLIIGVMALALSVLFFIAYNWLYMGKMAKFALVEGILAISILAYAFLVLKRQYPLIQQLLLLFASLMTGGLLALFGQVYQTGADTWQLFFNWALLIIPWALIARMPTLWLLFLGLLNISLVFYMKANIGFYDDRSGYILLQALLNFIAFGLWIYFTRPNKEINYNSSVDKNKTNVINKINISWHIYIVASISAYTITYLAIFSVIGRTDMPWSALFFAIWLSWLGFVYWQFRKRCIDLFILTLFCVSITITIVAWFFELFDNEIFNEAVLLFMSFLVISLSSGSFLWLRKVSKQQKHSTSSV